MDKKIVILNKKLNGEIKIRNMNNQSTFTKQLLKDIKKIVKQNKKETFFNICGLETCDKRAEQKCSKCGSLYYCSKSHQKQDWKRHKPKCDDFDKDRYKILKKGSKNIQDIIYYNQELLWKKLYQQKYQFVIYNNGKFRFVKYSDYKRTLMKYWDKKTTTYHISKVLRTKKKGIFNIQTTVGISFTLDKEN